MSTFLSHADTIPALLTEKAALGEHLAIVDGDRRISYAELKQQADLVGRAYIAAGVQHGDRVAVWIPNRAEFILAIRDAQSIGAAVVPLNTRYTGHEAAYIIGRSRATAIVLNDGFLGKTYSAMLREGAAENGSATAAADAAAGAVVPGLPSLKIVVSVDDGDHDEQTTAWDDFLAGASRVSEAELQERIDAVTPDDMVDMLFTSGTTGNPKGVMCSQRQTTQIAYSWALGAELTPDDRYGIVNPMFHGFGYKAGLVSSLVAGSTIYPLGVFEPVSLMIANAVAFFTSFGMFANHLLTMQEARAPLSTDIGLGLPTLTAGLVLVPFAIAMIGGSAPTAALMRRHGTRMVLLIGCLIMALAFGFRFFVHDGLMAVLVGALLAGVGTALVFGTLPTLVMDVVPATQASSASGLNSLLRSFSGAAASAAFALLLTTFAIAALPDYLTETGLMIGFGTVALFCLFSAVLTWFLPRHDASAHA